MKLYWRVARLGFRRYSTYVGATLGGLFTNTFFGFFRAYIFIAVYAAAGTHIGGFDLKDALTYSFLTQSMIMAIYIWGWWDIALSIRSGDIVTDLFRPFDYQMWWLAQDLGRSLYHLLTRGLLPFIVGALAFDLRLPQLWTTWPLMLMSVFLAVIISFAIRFILNLLVFWTLDYRGMNALATLAWTFLCGLVIPLAFLPPGIKELVENLPFASTVYVPMEIFLEKYSGGDLVFIVSRQLLWATTLLVAGRAMLSVATKRLVTQGG